LPRNYIRLDWP